MQAIKIIKAQLSDAQVVAQLVEKLLIELEPSAAGGVTQKELTQITQALMTKDKIQAYLAYQGDNSVGVITLHECAAIYAGGIFGEISELYVAPEYRSLKIGDQLINEAKEYGRKNNWQRLEVGTPSADGDSRTAKFYERQGFNVTGLRMRCLIN